MKKYLFLALALSLLLGACRPPENPVSETPSLAIITFDDGPLNKDLTTLERDPCPTEADLSRPVLELLDHLDELEVHAVFYTTGWGEYELNPECERRGDEFLRSVFQKLATEIHHRGQILALHAFDHHLYHTDGVTEDDLENDILTIINELELAGIPYVPLWRTPYFSHQDFQHRIAERLGLKTQNVDIDSGDSFSHPDNFLHSIITQDTDWLGLVSRFLSVAVSLAQRPTNARPYNDTLFHVNGFTSRLFPEAFADLEEKLARKYNLPDLRSESTLHWFSSEDDPLIENYISLEHP